MLQMPVEVRAASTDAPADLEGSSARAPVRGAGRALSPEALDGAHHLRRVLRGLLQADGQQLLHEHRPPHLRRRHVLSVPLRAFDEN